MSYCISYTGIGNRHFHALPPQSPWFQNDKNIVTAGVRHKSNRGPRDFRATESGQYRGRHRSHATFSSVARNDMIMNTPMDINSGMMVFHGYNVRFYDCLCATDDWLVLLELPSEYNP
jgi:hypothetical protein